MFSDLIRRFFGKKKTKIAFTYGRFLLLTTGHIRLASEMKASGADEVIMASNQADFYYMEGLLGDSVKFLKTNKVFKIVPQIKEKYGEDVEIEFFVGEDQLKLAESLQKFYGIKIKTLKRSAEDPSSSSVRRSYRLSEGNFQDFQERCFKLKLVKDSFHCASLFEKLQENPTL